MSGDQAQPERVRPARVEVQPMEYDQQPVTWTVTGQQDTTDLDATGRAVRGYRIDFTTGLGNHGSVFVPKARYSVESARAAIMQHAAELDQVSALSS
jgi:hypothetical protein